MGNPSVQFGKGKVAVTPQFYFFTINDDFDFLVIANAEDSSSLERFVTNAIKPLPGIAGIKTLSGIDIGPAARLRTSKLANR